MPCCGGSNDVAEKKTQEAGEGGDLLEVTGTECVEMREQRESYDQILHFPDDSQQVCLLEKMQLELKKEVQLHESVSCAPLLSDEKGKISAEPQPLMYTPQAVLTPQPANKSVEPISRTFPSTPQVTPATNAQSNVALLQWQIQLYDQLIRLAKEQQQELSRANASGTSSAPRSFVASAPAPIPPPPPVQPTVLQSAKASPATVLSSSTPAQNTYNHYITPQQTLHSATPDTALSPAPPTNQLNSAEQLNAINPNSSPVDEFSGMPQAKAYQSGVVEVDSNALARLLKKHFNNFVLECEFNATGNMQGYDIMRSRRCDQLEVDNENSSGHNLTLRKVKSIADLFLRYCMNVIDAQRWGGELRYAIKRPAFSPDSICTIFVNGSISYLSFDKTMKHDAPYQLQVDFILVEDE